MIRVSIVGATGYTGGELLRYLIRHPDIQIAHLTSESFSGVPIDQVHRFLKGRLKRICEKMNPSAIAKDSDVAFLGLPHGTAARTAKELLDQGVRVIDLSADFRLKEAGVYKTWYGEHPVPHLLKEAVYGLPEVYRALLPKARLVANPGCYATAIILGGLPIMSQGFLGKGPVIVDAKSGVSGAGKKLESMYLYCEANETMQAYALKGHRHEPEVWQEWKKASRRSLSATPFTFVPHLSPMTRGIFATLYFPLAKKTSVEGLRELYSQYFLPEPFVTVLEPNESPEVKSVAHTNHCQIGVAVDKSGRQAIVMVALDNLVKGASGQAIQNMNVMFGLEETKGLL